MKWPMAKWAVKQIFRDNGVIEDLCEHGVGHPNRAWLEKYHSPHNGIHGCDGCCWKEGHEENGCCHATKNYHEKAYGKLSPGES